MTLFYLAAMEDLQAQRNVLSFLNERLDLKIDLSDLDQEVRKRNEQLARARSRFSHIDDCINGLESNIMISEEETGELSERIEEFLRGED